MQHNPYKKYYNYLEKNWTKKLANHIIAHEKNGEEKYNIDTTGIDNLQNIKKLGVDVSRSQAYLPAPYDMLLHFFDKINLSSFHHFVDIGCGKGRTLCVAASYGIKKISGVELSTPLCAIAKQNIAQVKKQFKTSKFALHNNDAFYYTIEKDIDCIFMFNPFNEIVMSGVLENIEKSLARHPRKITIIYMNPVHKKMIMLNGYKETYSYKKMRYLEGVVLEK